MYHTTDINTIQSRNARHIIILVQVQVRHKHELIRILYRTQTSILYVTIVCRASQTRAVCGVVSSVRAADCCTWSASRCASPEVRPSRSTASRMRTLAANRWSPAAVACTALDAQCSVAPPATAHARYNPTPQVRTTERRRHFEVWLELAATWFDHVLRSRRQMT